MKRKKRPRRPRIADSRLIDPPKPCPRCSTPLRARLLFNEDPCLDVRDIPVVTCGACRIAASYVAGIAPEWRPDDTPDLVVQLLDDAIQALRHRHFLTADISDPLFR